MASFISKPEYLYDFNSASQGDWYIVNDGVMGGLSEGNFNINDKGHGVFTGHVSLDNNGGCTSIRHRVKETEIQEAKEIVLKVKGDGKRFQLRLKENREEYYSYVNYFETNGKWQTISMPLKDFYPTFRGRKLSMDNYNGDQIEEISILIANYKEEDFTLEIDYIGLK